MYALLFTSNNVYKYYLNFLFFEIDGRVGVLFIYLLNAYC